MPSAMVGLYACRAVELPSTRDSTGRRAACNRFRGLPYPPVLRTRRSTLCSSRRVSQAPMKRPICRLALCSCTASPWHGGSARWTTSTGEFG
jgi:hypothetical protein